MNESVDAAVIDAMDHFLPFIIEHGADYVQNAMDSEVFDFFGSHVLAGDKFGEWLNDLANKPGEAKNFSEKAFAETTENKRLRAALAKMVDTVIWMSGSNDFGPDGQAHQGWLKVQPAIDETKALLEEK